MMKGVLLDWGLIGLGFDWIGWSLAFGMMRLVYWGLMRELFRYYLLDKGIEQYVKLFDYNY